MNANLRPVAVTDGAANHNGESTITLADDLLIALADWTFLVGSVNDARWLESLGLSAVEWTRPELRQAIGGRKLILVTPDDPRSQRFARDLGAAIAERGLAILRVWVLAGLGSQAASLQGWCQRNDFSASLMRERPWEQRAGNAGGVGDRRESTADPAAAIRGGTAADRGRAAAGSADG